MSIITEEIFSKNILHKVLFALFAGFLVPFAFSPFDYYLLSIISITIIFLLWSKCKTPFEAFILGYIFAFMMFGIGVNWLHISINLFGGINLPFAILITFSLVAFLSLYSALCGYILVKYFKSCIYISYPIVWLLCEWTRGFVLTGFPWLNIGTSQTNSLLINFAPIIGDYGVTFIVCIIASLIVQIIRRKNRSIVIGFLTIVLILLLSILLSKFEWTKNTAKNLDIAIIQGAIPQEIKWNKNQEKKSYEIYSNLSKPFWKSDLIIWPETAISSTYKPTNEFIKKIDAIKLDSNTLFMSGIIREDNTTNEIYNSVLIIDDDHYFYDKNHLVPFGEYLPFKKFLYPFVRFFNIPISDFSQSRSNVSNIKTERANFGVSICYEDAFGKEIRRSMPDANILINVSNDAWFGDSLAPHQHLQIARMRAAENSRYFIRSTNTGISAIITNKGKILAKSPQFKKHVLNENVMLHAGETPFSKYGNNLLFTICSLLILINCIFFKKRKKESY